MEYALIKTAPEKIVVSSGAENLFVYLFQIHCYKHVLERVYRCN